MNGLVGKRIGQYEVTAETGRGGMAIVYQAVHPALGRTVAIKVLPAQSTITPMNMPQRGRHWVGHVFTLWQAQL